MVKPGGTGSPRLAISARLAPLPPSKSRNPALPSALPSPKVNTHLPAFIASVAALLATTLLAALLAALAVVLAVVLGAGLAGLFFSALRARAGGAALARAGADGFDFAAVFLSLDAALAMTANNPLKGTGCAPYTTFGRPGASREDLLRASDLEHLEQTKARQTDEDQIDRDHQVQEARHD